MVYKSNHFQTILWRYINKKRNEKINELAEYNIGTILDYSVEGKENEESAGNTVNEIKTIERGIVTK